MHDTSLLGLATLLIACVSYGIYIRDVYRGRTKPHGMSWLIWAVLNVFIFWQQITNGAGPGAWITGATAIANLGICILSLRYGERSIAPIDWLCLSLAGVALGVWLWSSSAALAVMIASGVFVLGFIPTFYKSFAKPHEETMTTFSLNSMKFLIALLALETFSVATAFYPATLFIVNAVFVGFLLYRRSRVVS